MNLLIFVVLFGIFDETEQCENFKYTKDVFAPNTIQIIANVTPGSLDYLRGVCTADCYASVQCNAVDFCGTYCRLIRGWDSFYNGSSLGTPCQRYQIECSPGQFYDRVLETCVSHDFCDFESEPETSCFLTEEPSTDNGDWTRGTGPTITSSTGPSAARFGSYYKYMNAAPLKRNEEVTLVSSKTFQGRSYCLTFYYHMLGSQMGDLTVSTQNGTEAPVGQWSVSGVNQDEWKEHRIDLSLDPHTKILITAKAGNGDLGDIAVDLLELWPYPC
uniref:MAM and LDL-receptor class A domain-containing protein 1-like n=1 Tax=Crassostrea virginica TaxID=6565 RepID=A0A8B8BF96_CRAVI|nr:MAM and LDL-receptor class A domain-containing protein 1-like [Crassostrea virginica]